MIVEALAALALQAGLPPVLAPRDVVEVAGTRIVCDVGDGTVGCNLRAAGTVVPGSYGFVANDAFAVVVRAGADRKPQLVVRQPQPALAGAAAPRRPASSRPAVLVGAAGASFRVPGSHLWCLVTPERLVACSPLVRGDAPKGAYQVGLGSRSLQLARVDAAGNAVQVLVRVHGA